jgi:hypothetical protein
VATIEIETIGIQGTFAIRTVIETLEQIPATIGVPVSRATLETFAMLATFATRVSQSEEILNYLLGPTSGQRAIATAGQSEESHRHRRSPRQS